MASDNANIPERASGFRPTVWGDFFISYSPKPLQAWLYMYNFPLIYSYNKYRKAMFHHIYIIYICFSFLFCDSVT